MTCCMGAVHAAKAESLSVCLSLSLQERMCVPSVGILATSVVSTDACQIGTLEICAVQRSVRARGEGQKNVFLTKTRGHVC